MKLMGVLDTLESSDSECPRMSPLARNLQVMHVLQGRNLVNCWTFCIQMCTLVQHRYREHLVKTVGWLSSRSRSQSWFRSSADGRSMPVEVFDHLQHNLVVPAHHYQMLWSGKVWSCCLQCLLTASMAAGPVSSEQLSPSTLVHGCHTWEGSVVTVFKFKVFSWQPWL